MLWAGALSATSNLHAEPPDRPRVAVLFGDRGPYRPAAEALAASLRAAGHDCELVKLATGDAAAQQQAVERLLKYKPTLVATGGAGATVRALEAVPEVPVVFFLVPNALDAPFMASGSATAKRLAGVTSDIDPNQQIDWILKTYPKARRVAVLCSERSQRTGASLQKAGRKRGLEITPIRATRDEFPRAIEALNGNGCDGVLMIPDAKVYSSPSVQRLLLWGIRNKKPVWAFSDKVVKAGAFAGLYCDSRAVGNQAAVLVREIIGGKQPATIGLRYRNRFGRAVNVRTAEMIGASPGKNILDPGVVRFGERE